MALLAPFKPYIVPKVEPPPPPIFLCRNPKPHRTYYIIETLDLPRSRKCVSLLSPLLPSRSPKHFPHSPNSVTAARNLGPLKPRFFSVQQIDFFPPSLHPSRYGLSLKLTRGPLPQMPPPRGPPPQGRPGPPAGL